MNEHIGLTPRVESIRFQRVDSEALSKCWFQSGVNPHLYTAGNYNDFCKQVEQEEKIQLKLYEKQQADMAGEEV